MSAAAALDAALDELDRYYEDCTDPDCRRDDCWLGPVSDDVRDAVRDANLRRGR